MLGWSFEAAQVFNACQLDSQQFGMSCCHLALHARSVTLSALVPSASVLSYLSLSTCINTVSLSAQRVRSVARPTLLLSSSDTRSCSMRVRGILIWSQFTPKGVCGVDPRGILYLVSVPSEGWGPKFSSPLSPPPSLHSMFPPRMFVKLVHA